MIFTLHRGKYTCIIKVNPFHDDTAADEKYQFTCSVVFSATGPSWKGLISVTGKVGNVKKKKKKKKKKTRCDLCTWPL